VPSDITELLQRWGEGDASAFGALVPLVYEEMRKLAYGHMVEERADHTLQPTALVNEAYLRLVQRPTGNWKNRSQFYAVASQVIRRVLVDHARGRLRQKRGSGQLTVVRDPTIDFPTERSIQLTSLDDALDALAKLDPRQARIVELRFFAGLSLEEIAEALELSLATVKRGWSSARAWLIREMKQGEPTP